MKYIVTKAEKTGEWEGKFGLNHKITLVLEDPNGETVIATLNQKPETPLPQGEIEGEIVEGKYGKEFKKERLIPHGITHRSTNPEERRSIERQVAFKGAVEVFVAQLNNGGKVKYSDILKLADTFVGWLTDHKAVPEAKVPVIEAMDQPFPEDESQELAPDDPVWKEI